MEERCEVLDLPSARPELEHATAVEADPVRLAVGVERKQLAQAPEARRLRVENARRKSQALDVRDRVDRRVPGDPPAVLGEHELGLVGQRGILEERLRETLRHAAVEVGVGGRVALGAVVGLVVGRDDRARLGELGDQLVRPVARGIELEAVVQVELQPAAHNGARRRIAEAR